MEQLIDEEIMKNHNQADAFISLFFAGLDAVCYIVLLSLFGFNFKSWNSPKQKLFLLLVMDAVIRIIDMYTDEYSKYFFKEFFFTLISTLQFNIILSILSQIFTEKEADLEANSGIRNKSLMSAIFFGISFSFKGIFTNYKFISCIQYICSIIGISMLSLLMASCGGNAQPKGTKFAPNERQSSMTADERQAAIDKKKAEIPMKHGSGH